MAHSRLLAMASSTTMTVSTAPADLSHHYNPVSRGRKPSEMKSLYKYFLAPGMTNLAGGLPFPGYFPFDTLEADISPSGRFTPSTPLHLSIPKYTPPHHTPRIDVATALQYGMVSGLDALTGFIREFALTHLHRGLIPYSSPGPEILLTCGNTDGLGKVISLFGKEGDNMLVEEFTYPNSIQTAAPFGIGIVPVGMDGEGMRVEGPRGLREVLEGWDEAVQGRRPHLMYTVTIGQNPTGVSLSLRRRREIYALCERFDVIIIEDDPYWYLQYTESSHPPAGGGSTAKYPFLEAMTPSFVTIDTSGRVVRLDTFSKTIAPGCRLGWITAQPAFIDRFMRISEASSLSPSGFVQAMVAQLLTEWGMDGWVSWLENLRGMYEKRMLSMCAALEKHAEAVVAEVGEDGVMVEKVRMYDFEKPMGGMFVWVRVNIRLHPAYEKYTAVLGHTKLDMMMQLWGYVAETQLSLPCPGWTFAANGEIKEDAAAERLRFCFAAIEEEAVGEATERFGKGAEAFWGLSAEEIEEFGRESEERRMRGEQVVGVKALGWAGGVVGGGC